MLIVGDSDGDSIRNSDGEAGRDGLEEGCGESNGDSALSVSGGSGSNPFCDCSSLNPLDELCFSFNTIARTAAEKPNIHIIRIMRRIIIVLLLYSLPLSPVDNVWFSWYDKSV